MSLISRGRFAALFASIRSERDRMEDRIHSLVFPGFVHGLV